MILKTFWPSLFGSRGERFDRDGIDRSLTIEQKWIMGIAFDRLSRAWCITHRCRSNTCHRTRMLERRIPLQPSLLFCTQLPVRRNVGNSDCYSLMNYPSDSSAAVVETKGNYLFQPTWMKFGVATGIPVACPRWVMVHDLWWESLLIPEDLIARERERKGFRLDVFVLLRIAECSCLPNGWCRTYRNRDRCRHVAKCVCERESEAKCSIVKGMCACVDNNETKSKANRIRRCLHISCRVQFSSPIHVLNVVVFPPLAYLKSVRSFVRSPIRSDSPRSILYFNLWISSGDKARIGLGGAKLTSLCVS